jgi:hypothetical protein
MNGDLRAAAIEALAIPREKCRDYANGHGIRESAQNFFEHVSAVLARTSV